MWRGKLRENPDGFTQSGSHPTRETDLTAKAETRRHFVLIRRRVAVRPVAQLPACVIAQKGENDQTSIKPYLRNSRCNMHCIVTHSISPSQTLSKE